MAKIALFPADASACGNYRLRWPGEVLAHKDDHGHEVVVNYFKGNKPMPVGVQHDPHGNVQDVATEADVVVLQRPSTPLLHNMILVLRDRGIRVVVDVDDALWTIHRSNVAWSNYNSRASHYTWLLRSLQAADMVTVTTEPLATEIAKRWNPNVGVVGNFIPGYALKVGQRVMERITSKAPKILTVGWAATLSTHPDDPSVTQGEVAEWIRKDSSTRQYLSVGGRFRELKAMGFNKNESHLARATGPVPIQNWYSALGQLDVSLVPLADSKFNRAKSWLKMLESAAAGCMVMASPTPDNVELNRTCGIGKLAKTGRWGQRLEAYGYLMSGADQVRLRVDNWNAATGLTIEGNAWRWVQAWEKGLGL